jgi:hypothetical protein
MDTTVWYVDDLDHPFVHALMERGIPAGHRFTMAQADVETASRRFEQTLAAFPDGIAPPQHDPQVNVTLQTRATPPSNPKGTHIQLRLLGPHEPEQASTGDAGTVTIAIHHLLSGHLSTPYGSMLRAWRDETEQREQPRELEIQGGHWVTLHDAARAVLRIGNKVNVGQGVIHVCGRRWWSAKDTWQELSMLSSRNAAGLYGTFTTDHLAKGVTVPIVVTEVTQRERKPPKRPDLGPLHRLLIESTGEGWRPNTPLRQGLMQALADMVERER